MHIKRKNGSTLYEQLKKGEELTGKKYDELIPPEYPPEATYLLTLFNEVSQGRQTGMAGALPLSWSDIQSYLMLTEQVLEPWEIRILKDLDAAYIRAIHEFKED